MVWGVAGAAYRNTFCAGNCACGLGDLAGAGLGGF